MAKGLFGDLGARSASEIQKELMADQRAQFQRLVADAPAGGLQRNTANIIEGLVGFGQAGTFGKGVQDKLAVSSPELEAAQGDAALMKGISEIEIDPTTPEYSRKVAEMARDAGNDKLAINALLQEGERKMAVKVATKKAEADDRKAVNAEFKLFPTAVQEEIVANNPDMLRNIDGMTPERAKAITARVEERNNFERAKAAKALLEVKRTTATKVGKGDVTAAMSVIDTLTEGDHTDSDELLAVSHLVAERTQAKENALKDAGEAIPERSQLNALSFSELQEDGIVVNDRGTERFGGRIRTGESLSIDADKLKAPAARRRVTLQ